MKTPDAILLLTLAGLLFSVSIGTADAQLISPGKLSEAHQHLEGIDNCTSCHQLRSRGIRNTLCLDCHTPLQGRIEQQLGYHATVADQNCGNCHKEHAGRNFNPINWDTTRFNHDETGYELVGKHIDLNCRDCHNPTHITDKEVIAFKSKYLALDHTFLGVGTECENCHEQDSPHTDQFTGQACSSCHNPNDWTDLALFDHDRARFKLLGQHAEVSCGSCHPSRETPTGPVTQYMGISFGECSDCHEDVHKTRLGNECSDCHNEQGWHRFADFPKETFPHEETGFALVGQHAAVSCSSCHTNTPSENIDLTFIASTADYTYPHPEVENCLSCHVDYHEGAFIGTAGGAVCDNCHTSEDWLPAQFDISRHNEETAFTLTGAHRATPCFSCHLDPATDEYTFRFGDTGCPSCHEADNPHGAEFANETGVTPCADCHSTDGWNMETTFNHEETDFPLTGAHITIACNDCHTIQTAGEQVERRFDNLSTKCESCHASDDPHHGQFAESAIGPACSNCHDTRSFTLSGFDHSRTRFPLDGAHINVPCRSCHPSEQINSGEPFTRFRPIEITCESCHGKTD